MSSAAPTTCPSSPGSADYDRAGLDAWLWGSGEMFEYWGHEASLIPVQDHYLWRWRMNATFNWAAVGDQMRQEHPEYLDQVSGAGS